MDLSLQDIQEYLHQQGKRLGSEYVFQCPECMDTHKDNLHYNPDKGILWCFANEQHSKQILSEIYKQKQPAKNKEVPAYIRCQEQYLIYQTVCNALLFGNNDLINDFKDDILKLWGNDCVFKFMHSDKPERARRYLKDKRGLLISDSIGIDPERAGKWVIPIYNLNDKLVGFEYRGLDFDNKRVWRERGSLECLAPVYGAVNSKRAVIVEGYMDGYVLAAHVPDIFILTPSHGVSCLLKVISELQFNKYEEICLILDNDAAGDDMTAKILKQYPFIKDCREFLIKSDVKDIGEYYAKN